MNNHATKTVTKVEKYTYCPNCDWIGEIDDIYCLKCGTKLEQGIKKHELAKDLPDNSSTGNEGTPLQESPLDALLWSINNFISDSDNIRFLIASTIILFITLGAVEAIAEAISVLSRYQSANIFTYSSPAFFLMMLLIIGLISIPIITFILINGMVPFKGKKSTKTRKNDDVSKNKN